MNFLLVEIIQPINCVLVSEDVPSISIVLSERRSNALKGTISNEENIRGTFYTQNPLKLSLQAGALKTQILNLVEKRYS